MLEGILNKLKSEKPEAPGTSIPQLGSPAPDFEAETTQGHIRLSDWNRDKWVILFSHPADFTPVCTTEFIGFAKRYDEFRRRNVALLGSSVDSVYAHIAWTRNIRDKFGVDIPFPIIADLDMKVARLFGMIHEPSSETSPVRAVFFIDPKRLVRALVYYPLTVGRNMDEMVRVIDGLQMVDTKGLAAPADWRPGQPAVVPPPKTAGEAEERAHAPGVEVTDWYFCTKKPA